MRPRNDANEFQAKLQQIFTYLSDNQIINQSDLIALKSAMASGEAIELSTDDGIALRNVKLLFNILTNIKKLAEKVLIPTMNAADAAIQFSNTLHATADQIMQPSDSVSAYLGNSLSNLVLTHYYFGDFLIKGVSAGSSLIINKDIIKKLKDDIVRSIFYLQEMKRIFSIVESEDTGLYQDTLNLKKIIEDSVVSSFLLLKHVATGLNEKEQESLNEIGVVLLSVIDGASPSEKNSTKSLTKPPKENKNDSLNEEKFSAIRHKISLLIEQEKNNTNSNSKERSIFLQKTLDIFEHAEKLHEYYHGYKQKGKSFIVINSPSILKNLGNLIDVLNTIDLTKLLTSEMQTILKDLLDAARPMLIDCSTILEHINLQAGISKDNLIYKEFEIISKNYNSIAKQINAKEISEDEYINAKLTSKKNELSNIEEKYADLNQAKKIVEEFKLTKKSMPYEIGVFRDAVEILIKHTPIAKNLLEETNYLINSITGMNKLKLDIYTQEQMLLSNKAKDEPVDNIILNLKKLYKTYNVLQKRIDRILTNPSESPSSYQGDYLILINEFKECENSSSFENKKINTLNDVEFILNSYDVLKDKLNTSIKDDKLKLNILEEKEEEKFSIKISNRRASIAKIKLDKDPAKYSLKENNDDLIARIEKETTGDLLPAIQSARKSLINISEKYLDKSQLEKILNEEKNPNGFWQLREADLPIFRCLKTILNVLQQAEGLIHEVQNIQQLRKYFMIENIGGTDDQRAAKIKMLGSLHRIYSKEYPEFKNSISQATAELSNLANQTTLILPEEFINYCQTQLSAAHLTLHAEVENIANLTIISNVSKFSEQKPEQEQTTISDGLNSLSKYLKEIAPQDEKQENRKEIFDQDFLLSSAKLFAELATTFDYLSQYSNKTKKFIPLLKQLFETAKMGKEFHQETLKPQIKEILQELFPVMLEIITNATAIAALNALPVPIKLPEQIESILKNYDKLARANGALVTKSESYPWLLEIADKLNEKFISKKDSSVYSAEIEIEIEIEAKLDTPQREAILLAIKNLKNNYIEEKYETDDSLNRKSSLSKSSNSSTESPSYSPESSPKISSSSFSLFSNKTKKIPTPANDESTDLISKSKKL